MKYLFYAIILLLLLYSLWHTPRHEAIAVIEMDGVGWYRVSNFEVDEKKCVLFFDGSGEKIKFCGAYKITEKNEFHTLDSKPK